MRVKLTTDQVNFLNIFLMFLSAAAAFAYPFELFLLVYAVLGPLHYLTEISWLHDKQYYTRRKHDYLFLIAAGAVITLIFLGLLKGLPGAAVEFLIYMAFAAGLVFLLLSDIFIRSAGLLAAALAGLVLLKYPFFGPLFGLFFPTLVHVYVFTGLFLFAGLLKGRSLSGFLSLLVFGAVAVSFIFIHPAHFHYHPGDYVRDNYGFLNANGAGSSVFISLNFFILKAFGLHDFGQPTLPFSDYIGGINDFLYQDPIALSLMSFIAFAYTYHYLNWFSKTSIIRWHEVSRARMFSVGFIWIASLVLYAWNYVLGFKWLFFLSFAHVLLEFPLNHLTLINIGKELLKLSTGEKKNPARVDGAGGV